MRILNVPLIFYEDFFICIHFITNILNVQVLIDLLVNKLNNVKIILGYIKIKSKSIGGDIMKKVTAEVIVRNTLIVLTFISLIVISFYMTNEIYTCKSHVIDINIALIRNFCNSTLFNIVLWVDNFLL